MFGPTRVPTTLPLFLPQSPPDKATGLIHDATLLGQGLPRTRSGGRTLDSHALRPAMEAAFGGTDTEGAWVWKDAYDALEAAQVLFLRKFGTAMRSRTGCAAAMLQMLTRLAGGLASQMRREESDHFQQFLPPIAPGFVAAEAAALTAVDFVLEPSAGTGLLAIFAKLAESRLTLNEVADTRSGLLGRLFHDTVVGQHNAEQIQRPSRSGDPPQRRADEPAVLGLADVEGRFAEAAMHHIGSALSWLAEGGRLVAVTGHNGLHLPKRGVGPKQPAWRESFVCLQQQSRIVLTATTAGRVYVRQGTTIGTRLTGLPTARPGAERVIGRLVTPEALDRVYEGMGVGGGPQLSPADTWSVVVERGAVLDRAGGLQFRRALVMGMHRVDLTGFSDGGVAQSKALGLASEIIAWHLRLFVPNAEDRGPAILGAILDRQPLFGARARAAA
jgi:hypothetical protein